MQHAHPTEGEHRTHFRFGKGTVATGKGFSVFGEHTEYPPPGPSKNAEQASVGSIIERNHAKIVIPAQAASPPESVGPLHENDVFRVTLSV